MSDVTKVFSIRGRLRILLAVAITATIAGVVGEQIGRHRDRLRYPQVGRSIDVGGHSLNIYCSGKGEPTAVFDTFSHMARFAWSGVQPEVSRFTRACWYDRAGYGWSEPVQSPPTFRSDAAALHTLLSVSGEVPPYVFIGPGDAALRLRIYRAAYPEEVSGIVMINPIGIDDSHVDVADEAKGPWARHFGGSAAKLVGAACRIAPLFSVAGLFRLVSIFGHPRPTPSLDISREDQQKLDFLSDNPTASGTNLAVCSRAESIEQARQADDLADLPLVVLADALQNTIPVSAWEENRARSVLRDTHLSSRGQLVLTQGKVSAADIVRAVHSVKDLAANGRH